MTLPASYRNDRVGDGTTTIFPYTFKIWSAEEMRVVLTDPITGVVTEPTSGFSVTGVGSDGGNVVFDTAPADDTAIVFLPTTTYEQSTDLVNETQFFQERIEDGLDRLCRQAQLLKEQSARALLCPESEIGISLVLPTAAQRAGQALTFDAAGNPVASSPSSAAVSPAMQPVVAAVTLSDARDIIIPASAITETQLASGSVTSGKIHDDAVSTNKIENGAVTLSKLSSGLPFWGRILDAAAIDLTAAATATINRFHTVSLASASATITLPPVSGNAGAVCGFHVLSTNVYYVTIDGAASETIDGQASLSMYNNGTLLLYCTGSAWVSLVRELAPAAFVKARTTAGQVLTASTTTVIFGTVDATVGAGYNAGSGVYSVPADGLYHIAASLAPTTAVSAAPYVLINGTAVDSGNTGAAAANAVSAISTIIRLQAGNTVQIRSYNSLTLNTVAASNWLLIARIGDYS